MSRGDEKPPEGKAARVLCSIGGDITWNAKKGSYVYLGGDTIMRALHKDITFPELMAKLSGLYHMSFTLKYQLPDLDMDTLISVSGTEDVKLMMDEYEAAERGGQRLRLFLFPARGDFWEGRPKERWTNSSREASPRGTLSRPDSLQDLHSPRSDSLHSPHLFSPKSLPDLQLPPIRSPRNYPPTHDSSSSPRRPDLRAPNGLSPPRRNHHRSAASSPGPVEQDFLDSPSPRGVRSPHKRSMTSPPDLIDWSSRTPEFRFRHSEPASMQVPALSVRM